ncbi:MAG: Gfo/Idh/MocA family oxidoreductase [Myxococcota bacterium]|nr:Gfo/Idh/MocA family oxidoreductase [Myxococcota bacterium]
MKLRVAVVGAGIGLMHLIAYRALAEQWEIVGVVDVDEERREKAAAGFGTRPLASLDEALALPDLDVVDVCTPPHLHLPMIRQALDAGVHVICEKPLVGSLHDCDEVARLEAGAKGRLMPIFQYRFGGGIQKLLHLKRKGVLGRAFLASSETAWRRGADYYAVPWRGKWQSERGGCLLSHAIHNHDLVTCVMGPVESVFAHTTTRVNEVETEDTAAVSLRFADGSLGSFAVTLGAASEISRLRYLFDGVTVQSGDGPYDTGSEPWSFEPRSAEWDDRMKAALADFVPGPDLFEGQFLAGHRALVEDAPLPVTVDDARASLELVTALYASAATGQAVSLPIAKESPWYRSWVPDEALAGAS